MRGPDNTVLKEAMAACRGGFIAVFVFGLGINLLMLATPLYMLQVFDRVLSSSSTDTLLMLSLVVVIALVALAALEAVRGFVLISISTWLERRISGTVLEGSVAATLRRGGDPSIQGLRDLSVFRSFLSGPMIFPIMDAPWTPIFVATIFLLHPLLGWISLGGAIALFIIALINEMVTRTLLRRASGASINALRHAEAAVRNADVIEAMGMMSNLTDRWNRQNSEALQFQGQASRRGAAITAVSRFVRLGLQVAVLGFGAWLVIGNELTPGSMIAASILMGRALAPVEQAIGSWKWMIGARNAYMRVKQQVAETRPRGNAMPLPAPIGLLTVENLHFTHPSNAEPTIRGVKFELQPGEVLGLIGPTAAGKTTLARLLVGNLAPRAGHVRLDGMDVSQWESEDLGRHLGYLPQDVELFSGTVRENIARMAEGNPEQVLAAAQLAGVHEMLLGLPEGYEAEIGDAGSVLSGGQRQRVAFARAVYGNPRFIVLDEPNASLDSVGEQALINAIATLKERGSTIIVIAHRPNILRRVDKVLDLRAGRVHMFGPRDEVLAAVTGPRPGGPATIEAGTTS